MQILLLYHLLWCLPDQHLPVDKDYQLCYTADSSGNWEIYRLSKDGLNTINLTQHPDLDAYPSWSPDGNQIAFFSSRDGNEELYLMESEGQNLRRLTNHPAVDKAPCWSPDGRFLAFSSNRRGNFDIYLLRLSDLSVNPVTEHSADDEVPAWSSDGSKIAFQSYRQHNWDIYVVEVESKQEKRLTTQRLPDMYPVWSPSGRQIAYASMRSDNLNFDFELFIMDAESGQYKLQLTDNDTDDACPDWSEDSRTIVFQHEKNGRWTIKSIEVESRHQHLIVDNDHGWSIQPRWQKGQLKPVVPVVQQSQLPQLWGQIKKENE